MSGSSHWGRALRRFARTPVAMVFLGYLLVVVVVAASAPVVARHDPNYQSLLEKFLGSSSEHWLGTDYLGRDTFARIVHGARSSMIVTLAVAALAALIAVPIGLVSGYRSGAVDVVIMRLTDAMLSIPPLVMALSVAAVLGPGNRNLVIALVITFVPGLVRLVRGQALAAREQGYVEASKAIGSSDLDVIRRRILPHVLSPLLVQLSLVLGTILVIEASLSFLGLGTPAPNASWGSMLESAFNVITTEPGQILWPSLAIAITTLAFNAVGDGLRDALGSVGSERPRRGDVLGLTSVLPRPPAPASTPAAADTGASVLSIRDLSVGFDTAGGLAQVLDRVSLDLRRGEIHGLVGESGCGKTVTSMSVLRLLPSPPARIMGGQILFEGRDLLGLTRRELRSIRGRDIAMVFQDPMASLNPAFTVGSQLVEAQRRHGVSRGAAQKRAAELLGLVGIPMARRRLDEYPHTFSGGMRQRVLIAMALANDPKVLIADEPTTALDVTVQAQILDLIDDLRQQFEMAVLFVTHDLGVVQDLCDRVTVMYAGQVVEQGTTAEVLDAPEHPYTRALLQARPRIGSGSGRLASIPGIVPSAATMPHGCRFADRCPSAIEACAAEPVSLVALLGDRRSRCILVSEPARSIEAPA